MALDKLKYTYQDPAKVSELNVDDVLNVTNTINTTTINSSSINVNNGIVVNSVSSKIETISPIASNVGLTIKGATAQTANLQEWQNSVGTAIAKIDNLGNLTATSKSFDIEHPTKENMRLRYGSLEGPENGVYVRGITYSNIIELPDYWIGLVDENSITVSLTAFEFAQTTYVEKIEDNKIYIGGQPIKVFFTVYGERKDIDKLTVEY